MPTPDDLDAEIAAVQRELDELQGSLPAHSIKPSQLIRIEELEDRLAELMAARNRDQHS